MVMAIANLAMATGNIGREGVGVNPLRGQNNVQGSCDMGSFPHEFSGYRHVSDDATREMFERLWGVPLCQRAGPAHPQHDGRGGRRRVQGPLRPGRGHRPVRSRHPAHHGGPAGDGMRRSCRTSSSTRRRATPMSSCPGSSFLEKDGTFTNAERRISRVRKAIAPLAGKADWETTIALRQGARRPDELRAPVRDHGRDRRDHADFRRRLLRAARRARLDPVAVQRQGADRHADHACRSLRARQGPVHADRISCRPTSGSARASRCC